MCIEIYTNVYRDAYPSIYKYIEVDYLDTFVDIENIVKTASYVLFVSKN